MLADEAEVTDGLEEEADDRDRFQMTTMRLRVRHKDKATRPKYLGRDL